jgi:hypothetical protein
MDHSAALGRASAASASFPAASGRRARRKPRRGKRSMLMLPVAMLALVTLLGVSFVGYVLWPRWPGEVLAVDTPALPITVAGVTFNVKPGAMRVAVQKHTGSQERLDLAFLWPSLEPPGPARKPGAANAPRETERIFLTIADSEGSLSPSDRVRSIYPRYIAEDSTEGPGGLSVRAFRDGSPYQGEDLIFDPEAPDAFLVRCTRDGPASIPGTCLYDRRIAVADLTFRFPRAWLADWRGIVTSVDTLIASLRPASL